MSAIEDPLDYCARCGHAFKYHRTRGSGAFGTGPVGPCEWKLDWASCDCPSFTEGDVS